MWDTIWVSGNTCSFEQYWMIPWSTPHHQTVAPNDPLNHQAWPPGTTCLGHCIKLSGPVGRESLEVASGLLNNAREIQRQKVKVWFSNNMIFLVKSLFGSYIFMSNQGNFNLNITYWLTCVCLFASFNEYVLSYSSISKCDCIWE